MVVMPEWGNIYGLGRLAKFVGIGLNPRDPCRPGTLILFCFSVGITTSTFMLAKQKERETKGNPGCFHRVLQRGSKWPKSDKNISILVPSNRTKIYITGVKNLTKRYITCAFKSDKNIQNRWNPVQRLWLQLWWGGRCGSSCRGGKIFLFRKGIKLIQVVEVRKYFFFRKGIQ